MGFKVPSEINYPRILGSDTDFSAPVVQVPPLLSCLVSLDPSPFILQLPWFAGYFMMKETSVKEDLSL